MRHHMDTYADYAELSKHETKGQDYILLARKGSSTVAVIALHGGGIEAGTADLADEVAGATHSFYAFKGIKTSGNRVLHITSHRFDEPTGLRIVAQAETAVSLHGHRDPANEVVTIGGRNQSLQEKIRQALAGAGFRAAIAEQPGLQAKHPLNLCNRCRSGRGVQLEISRALREKMFDGLSRRSRRSRTEHFHRFAQVLRSTLW